MDTYAIMPLSDYTESCNAIREKTATTDSIKSSELSGKITEVYDAGKEAEYQAFWDNYLNVRHCDLTFYGAGWNDNTFKPPIGTQLIANEGFTCAPWFGQCDITDLAAILEERQTTIDISKAYRCDQMFYWATELTRVPEITIGDGCTSINNFFNTCRNLVTITKLTLPDNEDLRITNAFTGCTALENIVIGGTIAVTGFNFSSSTKLTKASITSIINALSTTTSAKTITFSATAVDNAFETSESAADGQSSTEWQNLIATKTNWTIALS